MNAPARIGIIRIHVVLRDAAVVKVVITSDRTLSLASALKGQSIARVGATLAMLHGPCGQSHAAAVRFAAAAAKRQPISDAEKAGWRLRLAAERVAEHLRSLFAALDRPVADRAVGPLRCVVTLAQQAARRGLLSASEANSFASAYGILRASIWPAATERQGSGGQPFPDRLQRSDDDAIFAALAADPAFSRLPHLPGRVPQTGPAARHGVSAADPDAARAARLAEVETAQAIVAAAGRAGPDWIDASADGDDSGTAAVETPRGRLHYRLRIGRDGCLRDSQVLAPTEWNFHPDGPFARALIGFRPGDIPIRAIAARAAAFDPCVAFDVSISEAPDA